MKGEERIMMDFNYLFADLEKSGDKGLAIQMSAYMRNQFPFLGIQSPKRREICKEFFKQAKKEKRVDWAFIQACWRKSEREYQYVATDYISEMKKYLVVSDVPRIKELIVTKSWWDTVDALNGAVGAIALAHAEVNDTLIEWSTDENFWLRRVAIDHQLSRKEKTDTDLLETIIKNNFGQTEFFINKAIGWSLRDYSKTNPEWVRRFIEKYRDQLASLSIREGSKYI